MCRKFENEKVQIEVHLDKLYWDVTNIYATNKFQATFRRKQI